MPSHVRDLSSCHLPASWATIGIYDGVHRGHQEILRRLVNGAHAAGLPAVVVTFHPHPALVLGHQRDFKVLSTPEERAQLLHALGVDCVLTLTFTPQLAATSAEDFMKALSDGIGLQHLWIGYDFALGRNREGDFDRLQTLGKRLGYAVTQVQAVRAEGMIFSSSAVRAALRRGAARQAADILGRPYTLSGIVIPGDGRGRQLNLPTANLQPPDEKLVPADGVYATYAEIAGTSYPAVTNIGSRPTFKNTHERSIETHILDFQGNLYGQPLALSFVARLRAERRFANAEALLEQIHADIAAARRILPKPLTKKQSRL